MSTSDPRIVYGSLFEVPADCFRHYHKQLGFKEADATIAAFADWKEVGFPVSENRHFLQRQAH